MNSFSRLICALVQECRLGDGPVWVSSSSTHTTYCHPHLPSPQCIGDMAVGITAPDDFRSNTRPRVCRERQVIRWNVLGIVDLVVALSLGTLGATIATGAQGEISTAPLASLPLLVIPVFLVPLFLMLRCDCVLMQSRAMGR